MSKIFPDELLPNKLAIFKNSDHKTQKGFCLRQAKDSLRFHIFSLSGYF